MLKCSLYLPNVVCTAADVHIWVLGIFNRKSIARAFIIALPAAISLWEIEPLLSNRDANILIVKFGAIELEEID
jgi:hypothetical protein